MLDSTLLDSITASRIGNDDRKLLCAPANNASDEGRKERSSSTSFNSSKPKVP